MLHRSKCSAPSPAVDDVLAVVVLQGATLRCREQLERVRSRPRRPPWSALAWPLQDQDSFDKRRGRKRAGDAALEAPVSMVSTAPDASLLGRELTANGEGEVGEEDEDESPALAEVLHSATATMMAEDARQLLLGGAGAAGLEAYKQRFYRKMDAVDGRRVRGVRVRPACT